jgi:uncharacterized membrane protein
LLAPETSVIDNLGTPTRTGYKGKGGNFLESAPTGKSIHEMDRRELEEALPRLREEVQKAEEALRVAQQRVYDVTEDLYEVPTFVEVYEDHIVVDVWGKDKWFSYLSRLTFPLEHVIRAEADPNIEWAIWRGWRVPGVHVPGVRFYDMHGHRDKVVVIWLRDERYDRLVTEVQDPVEVTEKINAAVGANSSS